MSFPLRRRRLVVARDLRDRDTSRRRASGAPSTREKYGSAWRPAPARSRPAALRRPACRAQPPSANARRPPSISSPPPRLLTKSASMRSCSGVNDAASTLPRMMRAIREQLLARLREARRPASSGVVDVEAVGTCSRPCAAGRRRRRFLSSSTARRMNLASPDRGSPSKYSTFSRRSSTSISASRALFCVTCSPVLRRHSKAEEPRAGFRRREAHRHRRRFAVGRQRHLLRAHDAAHRLRR